MSTLAEIREDFVKKNGRYDLVVDTTDYVDNGANFYIQAGQRLLDTILPNPKSVGRYVTDIESGDHKVMMQYVRTIDSVWIKKSGSERSELIVKPYSWLLGEYGNTISDMTSGEPRYWATAVSLISPEQKDLTEADYTDQFTYDYEDILFGSNRYKKEGIIFRPKADTNYTMTIFAHFFSLLSADADISWHSEMYPELLLMASNLALEIFYRNSEGVKDWRAAMELFLRGIDGDVVRGEMTRAGNQLRG